MKVKNNRLLSLLPGWCILLICIIPVMSAAQKFVDPREAEQDFKDKNFLGAIKAYKDLLKSEPTSVDYHYKLGLCYLNSNLDKGQAVQYFEWITKQPKCDNEVWYELGRAYHYANKFTDAIKAFNRFKEKAAPADKPKADKEIEECNNGIELMKYPVNVTFENIGKLVNSPYPDYYPLVNQDETILIFTTRRPGGAAQRPELDGYYSSDIYWSHAINGVWQKAKSVGTQINTADDEEAVGINPTANELVIYLDHIDEYGDLYYSQRKGNTFSPPIKYNEAINAGFETSGSDSPDGEVLFFASNRAGGYGETDIYMAKKLPNGQWASPQNLGRNINTPYKEDFPWLDVDGNTLYFSSQGHSTMGDFDLFKSQWLNVDSNSWSPPQNLGYPVNTSGDDRCISFTSNHRVAYISRVRPEGNGDFDIYRVVFNELQRYAIIRGRLIVPDSTKPMEASITATSKDKSVLTFKPTRNGKYVMALLPGIYDIKITCEGQDDKTDKIIVMDMGSFQPETVKDYSYLAAEPVPTPNKTNDNKPKPPPPHRLP
jgi:tetratricopeptide (TPR) repeat protein